MSTKQTEKKEITELTPEQHARIPEFVSRFRAIGLSTEPTDKAKAEEAIKKCYAYLKMADPEIIWADDPFKGQVLAAQFAKGDQNVTEDEVRAQAEKASFGSFEAQWVAFYAFAKEVLNIEMDELINIVIDIISECGVYWTFEDLVILTPKPSKLSFKGEKLHNDNGLAIEYATGRGVYAVNGERVGSLVEAVLGGKFEKTEQ